MRPLSHRIRPTFGKSSPLSDGYARPRFEWHDSAEAAQIEVFVPGVESGGIEIVVDGNDLLLTARRPAMVLTNWQPANLGAMQLDYRLRVPLPYDINPRQIRAVLKDGVLTINLSKSNGRSGAGHGSRIRAA